MNKQEKKTLKEKVKILHSDIEFLLKSYQKYRTSMMICIEGESSELLHDIQRLVAEIQNFDFVGFVKEEVLDREQYDDEISFDAEAIAVANAIELFVEKKLLTLLGVSDSQKQETKQQ